MPPVPKLLSRFFRSDRAVGAALALAAFAVYLKTMSPGVGTEDPGELAAALHGLGITHPTGYPLFTMGGSLFARLPIGEAGIWRMNFFGTVLTAFAVFLFHGVFRFFFSPSGRALFASPGRPAAKADDGSDVFADRLAAVAATVAFAFSAVFWFEAVSLEVYALHLVFLALTTWFYLRALAAISVGADCADRRWILFAYALGLSFSHHMMTVLLAPAFLWLYFRRLGFGRAAWTRIATAAPPFLLALTAYLYLPIRSAAHPLMNWGEPGTPLALWKHVTAAQYGAQMFSSAEIAGRKLLQFFADLPGDFGYAPLALALAGVAWLAMRRRGLLVFSLLVFATALFYAVNYAFDDPNFNLHAHFAIALCAGAAVGAAASVAGRARRVALMTACALAVVCAPALNYARMDKSGDSLVEDYARNTLDSMDSGAVFFSNEYERRVSPIFYLQLVKGYRPDVAPIDIILLSNPWYFPHLQARFPDLYAESRGVIESYRAELNRFVANPVDTVALNLKVRELFRDLLAKARAAGRPVYFSSGINASEAPGYQLVASGLVFKLVPEEDSTPNIPPRDFSYRALPPMAVNKLSEQIRVEYAEGYANQGALSLQHGMKATAAERLRKALVLYPEFPEARALLDSAMKP
jgi:hypothetical protein